MSRRRPLDLYDPDELFTVALNLMWRLQEASHDPHGTSIEVRSLPAAIVELSLGPWLDCSDHTSGFGSPWALELEVLDHLLVRLAEQSDTPQGRTAVERARHFLEFFG